VMMIARMMRAQSKKSSLQNSVCSLDMSPKLSCLGFLRNYMILMYILCCFHSICTFSQSFSSKYQFLLIMFYI
jgi:hypothetical protein